MAIRLPLKVVLSSDNSTEVGAGSVVGGVAIPFVIPQDTDNIVVKFQAQTSGGGASAVFQTTDDGGTTWFDVQRTSVVSSATGVLAEWLSIPVISNGMRINNVASSVLSTIKQSPPSVLGANQVSGMPILSQQGRIFLILQSGVSATTTLLTEVKVNSQSATA